MSTSLDLGDETITMLTQEFDEDAVGFAADGSLMLPDLHKDEDVLKAVRALVANEPELSAQVVRLVDVDGNIPENNKHNWVN